MRTTIWILAVTSFLGCSDESRASDQRALARQPGVSVTDSIRIHRERRFSMGPDSLPLLFVLDAKGPALDSLTIQLTVSLADKALYAHSWESRAYFVCECYPDEEPAFRRKMNGKVVGLVESILDSGFVMPSIKGRSWEPESHQYAVLTEISGQLLPATATANDSASIRRKTALLQSDPLVDRARVVRKEQLTNTVFQYQYGSAYCIIGWSQTERRVLKILCGP